MSSLRLLAMLPFLCQGSIDLASPCGSASTAFAVARMNMWSFRATEDAIASHVELHCKAIISMCFHRPFEDAFESQRDPSPEPTATGRKRKLTAKGKSRYVDPSSSRADYVLEKGGFSLEEDE